MIRDEYSFGDDTQKDPDDSEGVGSDAESDEGSVDDEMEMYHMKAMEMYNMKENELEEKDLDVHELGDDRLSGMENEEKENEKSVSNNSPILEEPIVSCLQTGRQSEMQDEYLLGDDTLTEVLGFMSSGHIGETKK